MNMKRFPLILLFTLLCSCGIETFQPVISLAPPLGLKATSTNKQILLEFWGLNSEEYFSGYYIYIYVNQEELLTKGFVVPDNEGYTNRPTIRANPTTEMTKFSKGVSYYTNSISAGPLQEGQTYFFVVKAYSDQYNAYGDPSNIADVVYHTND